MAIDETTRKRWEKEDKRKKPSKENLLKCFDEMCLFLAIHGWTERDERAVAILKLIEQSDNLKDWTPTAENINALPEPVKQYIHDIETNCDPAGMVRENTILKDTIRQLQSKQQE